MSEKISLDSSDITKFWIKITWISNIWRISYSIAVCICCLFQGIKLQKTGIKLQREAEGEKKRVYQN